MASARTPETIWSNQTGFTLSNAGNVFLETSGGARTSWVPAGPAATGGLRAAGTHVNAGAGQASTVPVDGFRGWPWWRREHVFTVPVKGADRMIFEWRGEIVGDGTFANDASIPANQAKLWFASITRCFAVGSFVSNPNDPDGDYMWEPKPICYNQNQKDTNASVMSGNDQTTNADPVMVAGGFQLYARSVGGYMPNLSSGTTSGQIDTNNDLRYIFPGFQRQTLPFDGGLGNQGLSPGGLLWGYVANGTGGVSRYPKDKDRLGWTIEVGYADPAPLTMQGAFNPATPNVTFVPVRLKTTGLQHMWVCFYETSPLTVAGTGTGTFLNFSTTPAVMVVKGKIQVVRIDEGPRWV